MHLEYVEFLDHYSGSEEWTSMEEASNPHFEPMKCRSVGWVVAENKKMIRLLANLDDDPDTAEHGFGIFNVLKSDIVRRVRLTIPEAKRKAR